MNVRKRLEGYKKGKQTCREFQMRTSYLIGGGGKGD